MLCRRHTNRPQRMPRSCSEIKRERERKIEIKTLNHLSSIDIDHGQGKKPVQKLNKIHTNLSPILRCVDI